MPGMPNTPNAVETGANFGSSFRTVLAIDSRMLLPAPAAQHEIAGGQLGGFRFDHLSHGARLHHVADIDRIGIGSHARDPPAHVRIHRQVDSLDQRLPLRKRRNLRFHQREIRLLRQSHWPRSQLELPICTGDRTSCG